MTESEFQNQINNPDSKFRTGQKQPESSTPQNYPTNFSTANSGTVLLLSTQGSSLNIKKRSKFNEALQFSILSDYELEKLHQAKIDEINSKYKERITQMRENYTKVIQFHRARARAYIAKLKFQFKNYLESLRSQVKTEITFINDK